MTAPRLDVGKISKLKPEVLSGFDDWSFRGSSRGLYDGSFRENIHSFIRECALRQNVIVSDMHLWDIEVGGQNGINLPLYIIEKPARRPHTPFCSHCKLAGWGHHFVSKKNYHLILPEYDKWVLRLEEDCFDCRTHLLYGLIHCNGYGHLICINGVNENSDFPGKNDMMNLWDRICSMLHTRAISVCDEMDVRLLHVLAFEKSWYGKWGYEFKGDTSYMAAVKVLRSFVLEQIAIDLKDTDSKAKFRQIVDKYKKVSNISISKIGNLLHFMLALEARAKMDKDSLAASLANSCSRPKSEIDRVLTAIWNLLILIKGKNSKKCVVSMQQLKVRAEKYLENSELIEFVLHSIRFLKMDGHMICQSTNSSTNLIEFEFLEVLPKEIDVFPYYCTTYDCRWPEKSVRHAAGEIIKIMDKSNNTLSRLELESEAANTIDDKMLTRFMLISMDRAMFGNQIFSSTRNKTIGFDGYAVDDIVNLDKMEHIVDAVKNVDEDVLHLYRTLLSTYDDTLGIRILMERKMICVKEWTLPSQDSYPLLAFSFQVVSSLEEPLARHLSPGAVILVPPYVTKTSLKEQVQSALMNTYSVMENFKVIDIVGLENLGDDEEFSHTLLPGHGCNRCASVKGIGLDFQTETELMYQDGDRLIECINCHSVNTVRCRYYNAIRDLFVCAECEDME